MRQRAAAGCPLQKECPWPVGLAAGAGGVFGSQANGSGMSTDSWAARIGRHATAAVRHRPGRPRPQAHRVCCTAVDCRREARWMGRDPAGARRTKWRVRAPAEDPTAVGMHHKGGLVAASWATRCPSTGTPPTPCLPVVLLRRPMIDHGRWDPHARRRTHRRAWLDRRSVSHGRRVIRRASAINALAASALDPRLQQRRFLITEVPSHVWIPNAPGHVPHRDRALDQFPRHWANRRRGPQPGRRAD